MGKLAEFAKCHLTDVIGGATIGSPLYAYLETQWGGMSYTYSGYSKISGLTTSLLGLGSVFSRGRDLSRKLFKISNEKGLAKSCVRFLHDGIYSTLFAYPSSMLNYTLSGTPSNEKDSSTFNNMIVASFAGAICSISIDIYRDLMGTEECHYIPRFIKNQNPKIKRSLATLLTACSAAGTVSFYHYMTR